MGCNTVCAYLFWNQHEPAPGVFDFSGPADVARYCRIAQEEGLHVILRPGPYSCAEWEFGGFPWWLLQHEGIAVRTQDERYLAAVRRYLRAVGEQLAPLQVTRGGPILMVQVENEYGSYGNDKHYIGLVRDALAAAGFEVPMFTCDGPSQLPNGTRDDLFSVVNFGGDPQGGFDALRKVRATGPLMCGEYYPGWFDSWGRPHHRGNTDNVLQDLGWMLERGVSFSIYMVHGGTSFGFTAGANSPPFSPQSTSYDYDAPIDESGHTTPKYWAIRELFQQHLLPGETLPDVPRPAMPLVTVPTAEFREVARLRDQPLPWRESAVPLSFEQLGQATGLVRYRTPIDRGGTLQLDARDYAQISLDGQRLAILDRRHRQREVELPANARGELEVLVEAFGRINYGGDIHDNKGLVGTVELGKAPLLGFSMQQLPLDAAFLANLAYEPWAGLVREPAIYRGVLRVREVGDTFLDLSAWHKGAVWVNGHGLGRYWDLGPQQTLYLPGCWLREGDNEILVLDVTGDAREPVLPGRDRPILDRVGVDPYAPVAHQKDGQQLRREGIEPVHTGTFAPGKDWQSATFAPVRGRYVCLEATSSLPDDAFTTCAELQLLGEDQKPLPRGAWRIVYADSEELGAEDGNAARAIDNARDTFWHTQWQGAAPGHPHQLVLDLGAETTVAGLRALPRQDSKNGRIGGYRLFVRQEPFPGL
ncbi:MAG: beta-galactosidase, partial [Planctomycetes bacterium]|nr:beta-galactosidase [Planctomycetota bacterium]